MVFEVPTPLPMSIFDNVAYGPRLSGVKNRLALEETVEESLQMAVLWDEVKDRLHNSAMRLFRWSAAAFMPGPHFSFTS